MTDSNSTPSIGPTFPLDESAIQRSAWGRVLGSPVTWLPYLPVFAGFCLFNLPWAPFLGLLTLLSGIEAFFWAKKWPVFMQQIRNNFIAGHNRLQDQILEAAAKGLRSNRRYSNFGNKLSWFVSMKKKIETKIHANPPLTSQGEQLEVLVDSLCIGAMRHFQAIVQLDKELEASTESKTMLQEKSRSLRATVVERISEAEKTLQDTWDKLDIVLNPAQMDRPTPSSSLDVIVRQLREELDIAHRVHARLQSDVQIQPPPAAAEDAQPQ
ncbi:MAG: hypothetical protein HY360_05710 [Verrucomicrobia bacterium]|nr:hypothetical protein [Verrucomicrobiota bacterium]